MIIIIRSIKKLCTVYVTIHAVRTIPLSIPRKCPVCSAIDSLYKVKVGESKRIVVTLTGIYTSITTVAVVMLNHLTL